MLRWSVENPRNVLGDDANGEQKCMTKGCPPYYRLVHRVQMEDLWKSVEFDSSVVTSPFSSNVYDMSLTGLKSGNDFQCTTLQYELAGIQQNADLHGCDTANFYRGAGDIKPVVTVKGSPRFTYSRSINGVAQPVKTSWMPIRDAWDTQVTVSPLPESDPNWRGMSSNGRWLYDVPSDFFPAGFDPTIHPNFIPLTAVAASPVMTIPSTATYHGPNGDLVRNKDLFWFAYHLAKTFNGVTINPKNGQPFGLINNWEYWNEENGPVQDSSFGGYVLNGQNLSKPTARQFDAYIFGAVRYARDLAEFRAGIHYARRVWSPNQNAYIKDSNVNVWAGGLISEPHEIDATKPKLAAEDVYNECGCEKLYVEEPYQFLTTGYDYMAGTRKWLEYFYKYETLIGKRVFDIFAFHYEPTITHASSTNISGVLPRIHSNYRFLDKQFKIINDWFQTSIDRSRGISIDEITIQNDTKRYLPDDAPPISPPIHYPNAWFSSEAEFYKALTSRFATYVRDTVSNMRIHSIVWYDELWSKSDKWEPTNPQINSSLLFGCANLTPKHITTCRDCPTTPCCGTGGVLPPSPTFPHYNVIKSQAASCNKDEAWEIGTWLTAFSETIPDMTTVSTVTPIYSTIIPQCITS